MDVDLPDRTNGLWRFDRHEPLLAGRLPAVTDKEGARPLNALQQLIRGWRADHPDETYQSMADRASTDEYKVPRQTFQSVAANYEPGRPPNDKTIAALARGMGMPESVVRAAAGVAVGFGPTQMSESLDASGQIIMIGATALDQERRDELARRVTFYLAEMEAERSAKPKRRARKPKA